MWYGKMTNKKIAIIGASYLQEPLISKAKEMGIETHVFVKKYTWTVFAQ